MNTAKSQSLVILWSLLSTLIIGNCTQVQLSTKTVKLTDTAYQSTTIDVSMPIYVLKDIVAYDTFIPSSYIQAIIADTLSKYIAFPVADSVTGISDTTKQEYIKIGLIEINDKVIETGQITRWGKSRWGKYTEELRIKAHSMGGDGLIISRYNENYGRISGAGGVVIDPPPEQSLTGRPDNIGSKLPPRMSSANSDKLTKLVRIEAIVIRWK